MIAHAIAIPITAVNFVQFAGEMDSIDQYGLHIPRHCDSMGIMVKPVTAESH